MAHRNHASDDFAGIIYAAVIVNRVCGARLKSFPEVSRVVSQLGRPDRAPRRQDSFSCEFSVDLRPQAQWPAHIHKPS